MTADSTQTSGFSLQRASRGNVPIFSLQGHLGAEEFLVLERALEALPHRSPRRLILDCSGLASLASVNLVRLFLVAQSYRKHPSGLRLAGLDPGAQKLARGVGFDPELELQPDVETALKSLTDELAAAPERPEQEPTEGA